MSPIFTMTIPRNNYQTEVYHSVCKAFDCMYEETETEMIVYSFNNTQDIIRYILNDEGIDFIREINIDEI